MTKKITKGNPPNHVEWTESFLEGVNPFSFVPADACMHDTDMHAHETRAMLLAYAPGRVHG